MQSEPAAPSFIQYGPEHETGTAIARSVQQIFNTKNAKKIMHRFICSKAKKKVLKSYDFRTFLVEISGIEPLTS